MCHLNYQLANWLNLMKLIVFITTTINLICCSNRTSNEKNLDKQFVSIPKDSLKYMTFKLYYSFSGLGSNMGSLQPVFRASGESYIYTLEQNSYFSQPQKLTESICTGKLRTSSIDSILNIVEDIKDTLITKSNYRIKSGGIDILTVNYEKTNLTFQLQNASDSTASKIIDILNSNIPNDKRKL